MSNIRELSQLAASIVVEDSTRNIGIGTSSPSSKLSVGGDLNVSGVITATSFYGDGSGLTGISSFSGDYNDLINQPSIPSITGLASEGFVTEQVSNLIDGAPDALNTLNELAAALNDDSSFATSITNSLSTKISGVGIQSAGSVVGNGITTLNFIGFGNTFAVNGNVVDISISGGETVQNLTVSNNANVTGIITALSFVKSEGTSSQFLKADGSIDSNTYLTSYTEVDTLDDVTSRGNITSNGITVGIITASAFYGDGSNLSGVSAGSTVADDTSTDATYYPLFTQQTTGTITASNVSTTKLTFNPSSGTLNATELNATSDENLKENITGIDNPIELVKQLNGVEFDWKESKEHSMGVIAQEVEKILPHLVRTGENKSVNYNGLIGVLIEAIKEQQKQIDDLKNKFKE